MMQERKTNESWSRRELLAAGAAALAATASPEIADADERRVTGIVFEERDDAGRRGLAGVLVSNGRDVNVTDADGRYILPLPDEASIFVIKPKGFMPPVDPETQLPKFYRLHQPSGTPASLGLAFAGIPPTAPLPDSLDFPLIRQDEPEAFDVVLMTDPQPESDVELEFVRDDLFEIMNGVKARFGVTAGDIMFDDLSLYGRHNRFVGALGLPWWNVGGNHDLNYEAPDRFRSRETYKRVFGPNYYAFFYAKTLFLMLDDVDYLGVDRTKRYNEGGYRGMLDAAQLEFVRGVLAHTPEDTLIVLVMHIPLRTALDSADPKQNLINRDELFALFEGRRFSVSFAGHTHTTEHHYFGAEDGWKGAAPHHHHVLTALCGSWWSGPNDHRGVPFADSRDGSPNGLHVLSVDGLNYTTRFVPAKEPNARPMRILIDSQFHRADRELNRDFRHGQLLKSPVAHAALGATTVFANIFDAGPKTKAILRIGDRAPIEMVRRPAPDPFVVEIFSRFEAVKKPWITPSACSHLWAAHTPADLAVGAHRLVVEASDEYGRTVVSRIVMEVTG